jgi:hypothetical protein
VEKILSLEYLSQSERSFARLETYVGKTYDLATGAGAAMASWLAALACAAARRPAEPACRAAEKCLQQKPSTEHTQAPTKRAYYGT